MLTDTISQFLTKVRNASKAGHDTVTVRATKMVRAVCDVLVKRGYIKGIRPTEITGKTGKQVKAILIHLDTTRDPLSLTRVSKPGQRIYVGFDAIRPVRNGFGVGVLSTSRGVITDSDARKHKVGGEYICKVY